MSPRTLPLALCELDATGFAPFGHLPQDEGAPGDRADLEYLWADPHLNYIAHAGSEIAYGARGALCDLLNRHDTHTQVLMPVDTDAFVVVAPPAVDFTQAEHLESVRAFRVRRYQCFALHRGTWHWGPYPIDRAGSVRLLNVQGSRYREDNGIAWLRRDRGVVFEVVG
jgi:ureidoglycolate hydrolase-like protein